MEAWPTKWMQGAVSGGMVYKVEAWLSTRAKVNEVEPRTIKWIEGQQTGGKVNKVDTWSTTLRQG